MTLHELNTGSEAAVSESLKRCCDSQVWVQRVVALRPFADESSLLQAADDVWGSLTRSDWLEAFAQHPKIGQRSASKWSSTEQSGMDHASMDTHAAMHQLNIDYERKFGWIFIVCATGKTADEMRTLLIERLNNDPTTELAIAAAEQCKITKLRVQKLLDE